jgi:hypothetical protein
VKIQRAGQIRFTLLLKYSGSYENLFGKANQIHLAWKTNAPKQGLYLQGRRLISKQATKS